MEEEEKTERLFAEQQSQLQKQSAWEQAAREEAVPQYPDQLQQQGYLPAETDPLGETDRPR
jgi:hypothetical protein